MIIRMDDYPSGVRPIQPGQLQDFDRMLGLLESFGIDIHLGIVPVNYLRQKCNLKFKNIIPVVHGWDHLYEEKSRLLEQAGDPFNKSTIGNFSEFEGIKDMKILERLRYGKVVLEQQFGCEVDTYIPVCNIIDKKLADLLKEAGYKRILCENKAESELPIVKSDFYGRLDELQFNKTYGVISLHITWEWDTIREKGWDYWTNLVKQLSKLYQKPRVQYDILFKFPIRYRREKFYQTLDLYYKLIADKKNFLFLIIIDQDDTENNNPENLARLGKYKNLLVEVGNCTSKIEAVNYGIEGQHWDIVVIVSDDMIPKVVGFDDIIRQKMAESFPDLDGALWFNDGFQANNINTIQIMGRKWFNRWGYVYHPAYLSQRCDVEYQIVAKKFDRIRYFDQVIIRHEHADFGLIPYDKLLMHNYTFIKRDEQVFIQREKLGFPVGIPKIAHFIWSAGTPLNYLRYMTYKTFKDLHPDWQVMFHLVEGCGKVKTWKGKEKLEFESTAKRKDYLTKIVKTEIVHEKTDGILPNYASDLYRWKVLHNHGGFYFDLDQIFVKSFNDFLDYDIVWGGNRINYSGVVGMFKGCPIASSMYNATLDKIAHGPTAYCEAGNWLWSDFIIQNREDCKFYKLLQTRMPAFYPIQESYMAKQYFDGAPLDTSESYAVHWFGGHPDSQEFAKRSESEINKIILKWNS